jgi:hypothetical protein
MELPSQTSEIFKILSKGQFISSNNSDKSISTLYNIIDDEQNFENLYEYFSNINFILEKGEEFFYFSRPETKVDLENKIDTAFRWIDYVDFFKTFDNSFGAGYRFTPSEILVRIKTDAELEAKLESMKKHTGKDNQKDILDKVLDKLISDSFVELENQITHQYKVLTSFKYLEQLILTINIQDNVKDEIPE